MLLDAFVVSEQLVVAFNTGRFGSHDARLVALYPAEGTLWADHPLALIETADLTANQRRTFQAFREFLTKNPLDARGPRILLLFGRMNAARNKPDEAIADYRRLVAEREMRATFQRLEAAEARLRQPIERIWSGSGPY